MRRPPRGVVWAAGGAAAAAAAAGGAWAGARPGGAGTGAALPGLEWYAPLFSHGGFGSEARAFLAGLAPHAAPGGRLTYLRARQHGDNEDRRVSDGLSAEERAQLRSLSGEGLGDVGGPPGVVVCHSVPGAWAVPAPLFYAVSRCPPAGSGWRRAVGRAMFEADGVTPEQLARLRKMGEVWVPTSWHRGKLLGAGLPGERVHVVAQGVDTGRFHPAARPLPLPPPGSRLVFGGARDPLASPAERGRDGAEPERPFVFVSVFKWERRKGWDALLAAYLAEFRATEDVALVLVTQPFHSAADFPEQMRAWARAQGVGDEEARRSPAVYVTSERVPEESLPGLYAASDVFVLATRGEGWGRPVGEAMACGTPAVVTAWSGPSTFVSEATGFPVEVERFSEAEGFDSGLRWAEPSVASLRRRMHEAFSDRVATRSRGARARELMEREYSLDAAARQVLGRLEGIRLEWEREDAVAEL